MENIIVSFTSYPKRIRTVDKVLDSLVAQTVLPDRIILYLSEAEFRGFENFPNFEQYQKYGFEIRWHEENLRSHKKWFYVFQEYPNDIVITIDDDILYEPTALENLLKHHETFPNAVIARRAHLMTYDDEGLIAPYDNWYHKCGWYVGVPRMDLLVTGMGGALYSPNVFQKEIFNKAAFMEACPYADDLWLKIMEVYNEIPVVLTERHWGG